MLLLPLGGTPKKCVAKFKTVYYVNEGVPFCTGFTQIALLSAGYDTGIDVCNNLGTPVFT